MIILYLVEDPLLIFANGEIDKTTLQFSDRDVSETGLHNFPGFSFCKINTHAKGLGDRHRKLHHPKWPSPRPFEIKELETTTTCQCMRCFFDDRRIFWNEG